MENKFSTNVLVKYFNEFEFKEVNLDTFLNKKLKILDINSCKVYEQDLILLKCLKLHPEHVNNFVDEFKIRVLKGWGYEISPVTI